MSHSSRRNWSTASQLMHLRRLHSSLARIAITGRLVPRSPFHRKPVDSLAALASTRFRSPREDENKRKPIKIPSLTVSVVRELWQSSALVTVNASKAGGKMNLVCHERIFVAHETGRKSNTIGRPIWLIEAEFRFSQLRSRLITLM